MMNLANIDTVLELKRELEDARKRLQQARDWPRETVPTWAGAHQDYGRLRLDPVALLEVPKATVVSAAERAVAKVIKGLAECGVTVDAQEPR